METEWTTTDLWIRAALAAAILLLIVFNRKQLKKYRDENGSQYR